jgi:hypothetical protein
MTVRFERGIKYYVQGARKIAEDDLIDAVRDHIHQGKDLKTMEPFLLAGLRLHSQRKHPSSTEEQVRQQPPQPQPKITQPSIANIFRLNAGEAQGANKTNIFGRIPTNSQPANSASIQS